VDVVSHEIGSGNERIGEKNDRERQKGPATHRRISGALCTHMKSIDFDHANTRLEMRKYFLISKRRAPVEFLDTTANCGKPSHYTPLLA